MDAVIREPVSAALPLVSTNAVIRATLPVAASQDTVLQLSSSDPAITVPNSVTIPAGSLSANVNVAIGVAFNNSHAFSVTGGNGITTATAVASVATPGAGVGFITEAFSSDFRPPLPGQTPVLFNYSVLSRGGYQTTVSAHCENLPAGVTCQFTNDSLIVPAGGTGQTQFQLNIAKALPVGNYVFNVVTQDSQISQSIPVTYKVADFAFQVNSTGASALSFGFEVVQLGLSSINGFESPVDFTCSGLPANARCLSAGAVPGLEPSTGILVQTAGVSVGNYPFQIVGSSGGITTHSVNAVLHVGDFGATSITPTSTTLAVGQSATFNLTVNSINGFVDPLTLFCGATVAGNFTSAVKCTFSQVHPAFDSSGVLTDQITVTAVSIPTSARVPTVASAAIFRWIPPVTTALLLAAVFVVGPKKRRRVIILSCACLLSISTIIACGGGGAGTGNPAPTPTPTPAPQKVTVTVLGQVDAQTQPAAKSLGTFTVTVQ